MGYPSLAAESGGEKYLGDLTFRIPVSCEDSRATTGLDLTTFRAAVEREEQLTQRRWRVGKGQAGSLHCTPDEETQCRSPEAREGRVHDSTSRVSRATSHVQVI